MWFVWWIAIALGLGIVEVMTVDLIFLMIGIAALLGAVASWAGLGLLGQMIVFIVAALILLFLVRPWAKAHLMKATPDEQTNALGLVGKEGTTLTRVTETEGRVKIGGETWSARSAPGVDVPPGQAVTIDQIDGATAVVSPRVPDGIDTQNPY